MSYKIVKNKVHGFNVKYKKGLFFRWRYIMSEVYPCIRMRFDNKKEADAYIASRIADQEFKNKAKFFDPIP